MTRTERAYPDQPSRQRELREMLPVTQVKHEVIWVNTRFSLPFDATPGQKTDLGVFLTPKPESSSSLVETMPGHGRSAVFKKGMFKDENGVTYREVDLKGIGSIQKTLWLGSGPRVAVGDVSKRVNPAVDDEGAFGILDLEAAKKDQTFSEQFYQKGLRVPRVLALIELQEVVDAQGELIDVEQARSVGLIPNNIHPTIEVRAFATKARISDVQEEDGGAYLEEAMRLVSREQEVNRDRFSTSDYIKWFAETLGRQVGMIHKEGYFHGYLTPHNITLDCRILDFDSIQALEKVNESQRVQMEEKLRTMVGDTHHTDQMSEQAKIFDYVRAYASLETLLQSMGLSRRSDGELLKQASERFNQGYLASGASKLN